MPSLRDQDDPASPRTLLLNRRRGAARLPLLRRARRNCCARASRCALSSAALACCSGVSTANTSLCTFALQHRRVGFGRGQFGGLGPHRLLVELRRGHGVVLGAVRRPHALADRPQLVAVAVHHLSHLGPLVVGQVELPQHPQRPAEAAASEAARATGTARATGAAGPRRSCRGAGAPAPSCVWACTKPVVTTAATAAAPNIPASDLRIIVVSLGPGAGPRPLHQSSSTVLSVTDSA